MIEIKRWDNGEVIIKGDYESIAKCIEHNKGKSFYRADLRSADLRSAKLSSADLRSADLSFANLRSAKLRFAKLSSADLSSADLSSANLRSADLRSADLRSAKLSSADLSSADLSSANLRSANLRKRYIQVACIGSRKGMTTYCFDDDIIWCGCWQGTLEKFEERVKEKHVNNKQYLDEYLGFIEYVKNLKAAKV